MSLGFLQRGEHNLICAKDSRIHPDWYSIRAERRPLQSSASSEDTAFPCNQRICEGPGGHSRENELSSAILIRICNCILAKCVWNNNQQAFQHAPKLEGIRQELCPFLKKGRKPLIRQFTLISVSIVTGYSDTCRYIFCMSWNLDMCTDKKPDVISTAREVAIREASARRCSSRR